MVVYFESGDVGRAAKMGAACVRYHERLGRLKPVAQTVRGTKLYTPEAVEEFRQLYGRRPRGSRGADR